MKFPPRILLVENDSEFHQIFSLLLNRAGFPVTALHNGEEAVALLEDKVFDILITEVQLPATDKTALLEWVRKNRPQLRVFVISGQETSSLNELIWTNSGSPRVGGPVDIGQFFNMLTSSAKG